MSILFIFLVFFGVFINLVVDVVISCDDFDLRDICCCKMMIYVVILFNWFVEVFLFINLFFSIVIDQNMKILFDKDCLFKYLVLLLFDEFFVFGCVDKYVKFIGYIVGYGFCLFMIVQLMSQFKDCELYGEEGLCMLVMNYMVQIIYVLCEQQDVQEYSEIFGYYGLNVISWGCLSGWGFVINSENVSEQKWVLMLF